LLNHLYSLRKSTRCAAQELGLFDWSVRRN
jgi:hypothetical protein